MLQTSLERRNSIDCSASLHGNVVMIMIVVPSRTRLVRDDPMKRQIEGLVGKINGKFGRNGWPPILYHSWDRQQPRPIQSRRD